MPGQPSHTVSSQREAPELVVEAVRPARGATVEGAEIADAFHAGGAEEGGGVEFDDFEAESVTRR